MIHKDLDLDAGESTEATVGGKQNPKTWGEAPIPFI